MLSEDFAALKRHDAPSALRGARSGPIKRNVFAGPLFGGELEPEALRVCIVRTTPGRNLPRPDL